MGWDQADALDRGNEQLHLAGCQPEVAQDAAPSTLHGSNRGRDLGIAAGPQVHLGQHDETVRVGGEARWLTPPVLGRATEPREPRRGVGE